MNAALPALELQSGGTGQNGSQAALTDEQARILTCFQLGWKLEEFAANCRLGDVHDAIGGMGFPPDMPRSQVQRVQVLAQELTHLLGVLGLNMSPSENGQGTVAPPDLFAAVGAWVAGGAADPQLILAAALALDNMVVPYLVGQMQDFLFEAAYELGKGLSLTYWDVEVASQAGSVETQTRAWASLFAPARIDALQRHLYVLGAFFAPEGSDDANTRAGNIGHAMEVVASSVKYWRHTLIHLDEITSFTSRSIIPASTSAIKHQPAAASSSPFLDSIIQDRLTRNADALPQLQKALGEQQTVWHDVLMGLRSVEDLCPSTILITLSEDLVGHTWRRVKRLLPLLFGLFLTIALFGVMVGLGVLVLHGALGQQTSAWTAVLTVLGGGGTYVAALALALFRRGQSTVREAQLHGQEALSAVNQATHEVAQVTGISGTAVSNMASTALGNVTQQIRQEEYTIMASQPLLLFVLRRADKETGDPLQDATTFLRLVYQSPTNLDRLLAIFPEVYVGAIMAG